MDTADPVRGSGFPDDGLLDEVPTTSDGRRRRAAAQAEPAGSPPGSFGSQTESRAGSSSETDTARSSGPSQHTLDEATAVAENTQLARLMAEQFDLNRAIGGPRGILEGVLPVTVFSVWFSLQRDVRAAATAALVVAAVFAVWRLARREPLTQALGGVLGVGLGAFLAVRTGQASNYFLPAIVKNLAFTLVYAASIAFRWPLIGLVLGFAQGELFHWREVPARYRVYVQATWLWAGMFALRLAVQLPLYLISRRPGGEWATEALGFAAIPLGLPLFLIVAYLTWLIVRRVPPARPYDDEPASQRSGESD